MTKSLSIDATAPVTTTAGGLQATDTTGWTDAKTPVTVTLAAADTGGSGLAATYYRLGSSGAFSTYGGSFTVSAEGSTEVDYYSTDAAGNRESTRTGYVNIDTTAPATAAGSLAATPTSGWSNTEPVTVTLSPSDSGSGVATTYYRLGSGGTFGTYGGSFTVSTEGSTEVDYYATDAAGNVESTHAGYVNIDTTAPVTTATGADSAWHTTPVTLTFAALDDRQRRGRYVVPRRRGRRQRHLDERRLGDDRRAARGRQRWSPYRRVPLDRRGRQHRGLQDLPGEHRHHGAGDTRQRRHVVARGAVHA